jgi:hypothetical protein
MQMVTKKIPYEKITYHPTAKIAIEMAQRWGMVAAIPDGEDTAGRQKLRLMTPAELAQRAVATTLALVIELTAKGMMIVEAICEADISGEVSGTKSAEIGNHACSDKP